MEDIDEGEAHALASKWVKNITTKMGLTNVVECNLGKQVHSNDDDIDEIDHKRGDALKNNEPVDALCSLNYSNDSSLNSSQLCENILNPEDRNLNRSSILKPARFDSLKTTHCRNKNDSGLVGEFLLDGGHSSVLDNARTNTSSIVGAEIMPSLQNPIASNDELYDIWDFDERQKQTAECYLKGTSVRGSTEKENVPIVSEKCTYRARDTKLQQQNIEADSSDLEKLQSDHLSDGDVNQNYCKICPDCKQHNSLVANWCEECGKALISVEVTRIDLNSACSKLACNKNAGEDIVKKGTSFNSKLNPNCAEFVSAYPQPQRAIPLQVSNGQLSHHGYSHSDPSQHQSLSSVGRQSVDIGKNKKDGCISQCYDRVPGNRKHGDLKSNSFTEDCSVARRKGRQSRNPEKSRTRRRSNSAHGCDSQNRFSYASSPRSFESPPHQLSYSLDPRNELFNSPGTSFFGYSNIEQPTMSYQAISSSQNAGGTLIARGQYEFGSMQSTSIQTDYQLSTQTQSKGGSGNLISGFDGAGCSYDRSFQGLDFENPPLENPHMLGQTSSFNEAEFSRLYVQNALCQQIDFFYGMSNHQRQANMAQNSDLVVPQPAFFCLQNYQPTPDITYHRAYRKKKFVENGIESPRFARNLSRNPKHSHTNVACKQGFQIGDGKSLEQQDVVHESGSKTNSKSYKVSQKSPEVIIPPLKLNDLENYDQVLTLIRTSREEALPYLCLPEEVILYIFSFLATSDLCQCARVCHQFHRISVDLSLWKEIIIKKRKDLTDETLQQIAKKSPISLTITQCHSKEITEQGIRSLFQSCGENLLDLDFSACRGNALVGEMILLHVSTRCRNLRSLDISWSNVSDIGIQAVSEALKRLECLCMNGCQLITDESTRCIANRHGQSLRVLEVFGCFNITQTSLMILSDSCPNIETINIGQCHKVSDSAVSQFVRKAKRLENIDLRGCKQIRDSTIIVLASSCPNLSTLVIANCPFITDASLLAIASHLSNIRCIDVCGCPKVTDTGVQALARTCAKLQVLDLSSTKASNKAVISLANYCFKTLETLKMSFCLKITEVSLEHLAKKCTRLKLLHLYGCRRIKSLGRIQKYRDALQIETERCSS